MNVEELFQRLSFGELANLSIGSDGTGEIPLDKQPRIIHFANNALNALYTRFVHRLNYVTVEMQEGIQRYELTAIHAVTNTTPSNTAPRYIIDTVEEPFLNDVVRIVTADWLSPTVEVPGSGLVPLGDYNGEMVPPDTTIRLVSYNTLFVKNPVAGELIEVQYQARHVKLAIPAVLTEEILLAPSLEEALEKHIAAAVYSSMDGENQMVKARTLREEFEMACQTAKLESLLQEDAPYSNSRLVAGGWR